MSADPGINAMTEQAIRDEFDAGRMRPEWTWLAFDDEGRLIDRALWWGRDDKTPIALDVWDVVLLGEAASIGPVAEVGKALLRSGHAALSTQGCRVPLPHTVHLPGGWRSDPVSVGAVAWRQHAAADVGLTEVNERLQFEWTAGTEFPTNPKRLDFREGSNEEFRRLFGEVVLGSLDVLTQRTLEVSTPEDLGRDELEFYRSCPGNREWWRVAIDPLGTPVGFVVPSATPHSVNVGYLGVLPEHRGHGYVDDLLATPPRSTTTGERPESPPPRTRRTFPWPPPLRATATATSRYASIWRRRRHRPTASAKRWRPRRSARA